MEEQRLGISLMQKLKVSTIKQFASWKKNSKIIITHIATNDALYKDGTVIPNEKV